MAIAVFSFLPKHCPKCGRGDMGNWQDPLAREDVLNHGCACACRGCGLHWSYVSAEQIRVLAAGSGDMGQYVKAGEAE